MRKFLQKGLIFVLCVLFLPIFPAGAQADICFVAIDDTLPFELAASTMPFWQGGELYVPGTVFENASLGVYTSYDKTEWIYSLYNSNHRLDFYLTMMASYDSLGNYYEFKAVTGSDRVFVPCSFVCAFFGLNCTYISEGTAYPIVRITTGKQTYNASQFAANAAGIISSRASAYLGGYSDPTGGEQDKPNPDQEEVKEPQTNRSLALWLQVDDCVYTRQAAARLREAGVDGTFFYTRQSADSHREDLRQLNRMGAALAVYGDTLAELTGANEVLDSEIYTRTRLSNAVEEDSAAAGYIPFYWHIDANSFVSKPETLHTGDNMGSVVVLKVDLSLHSAESFGAFVDYIADSGYRVYPLQETFLCR